MWPTALFYRIYRQISWVILSTDVHQTLLYREQRWVWILYSRKSIYLALRDNNLCKLHKGKEVNKQSITIFVFKKATKKYSRIQKKVETALSNKLVPFLYLKSFV